MIQEKISIIVPTYNECDNIEQLIKRVDTSLQGYDCELIVVDDNSTDGTIDIVKKLSSAYPVKLIVRTTERGLATAVIEGIRQAQGNLIGVIDADLQHPPEVLPSIIKAIEDGADIVFASRYVPGGGVPNWGLLRRIISKGAGTLAHIFLPSSRRINDPMSGFFMFRRKCVDINKLKPTGYKIALEVLLTGDFKHPAEVPFIFEERSAGSSKLKWNTQLDYLKHIFSLMRRTGELTMFIKFVIVGLTGTVVNIGLYTLLVHFTGLANYDWLAVLIGIEVSIITNFLLNDTFTFKERRAGRSFINRLGKFNLMCLTGAAIQWGIFMLLTRVFNVYDILSNFTGIVVAFLWNYFINRNWTWR